MNPTVRTTLQGVLLHDRGVLLALSHDGVWDLPSVAHRPHATPAETLGSTMTRLVGATVRVGIRLDHGTPTAPTAHPHHAYRCHLTQLWTQRLSRDDLNTELRCPDAYRLLLFIDPAELDDLVVAPARLPAIRLACLLDDTTLAA